MFKTGDATHNTIYLGTGSSGLWVTKNANNTPDQVTWVNLTDNSNLPTLGVTSFDINPSNPQEIYVASALTPHLPGFGYGLGIIKTTDGGATWQRSGLIYDPNLLDDNNKRITCLDVKIHPTMNHIVFAICGDVIWKSTDAGATFTNVFELNDDNLPFRELVFHPSNPNTIYASSDDVESNDGGAELFVSYNGGDLKQAIQDSLAVVVDMITTGTGKALIQAKAMINYAGGIQWYPPVVLPAGGNAPLSRSDAGIALPAPVPKVTSNNLVILPNPASGQVTIKYTLDLETIRAAIDITDIEGKTIILLPVSDFKGEIQLADSRLLPGIYAVRLLVDDFPVRIQKLVIIK